MRLSLAVSVLLFLTSCFSVVGQDPDATRVKLENARANHQAELEIARTAVIDRYQEVLKSLAKKGELDESLKLRDEMSAFQSEGTSGTTTLGQFAA